MSRTSAVCRDTSRRVAASVLGLTLGVLALALGLGLRTDLPWEPTLVLLPAGALALWKWQGRRALRELTVVGETSMRTVLLIGLAATAYTLVGNVLLQVIGVESAAASPATPGGVVVAIGLGILIGGLLTALPEELVFRGVLLQTLAVASGPVVALSVTSLLFSLMHLPNALFAWEVTGWILVSRLGGLLVIGAALASAAFRSGTIWVAIAWHGAANIADIAWGGLLAPEVTDAFARELWRWALVAGEAALLIALVALRWPPVGRGPRGAARPPGGSGPGLRPRWTP